VVSLEKSLITFKSKLFNNIEISVFDEVVSKFKNYNAKEIRKLSHEEEAWINNEKSKGLIDYNDSFKLIHV
jgi:uncharacterized phage-associated protein